MTRAEFHHIITDVEKNIEGNDGYFLRIHTHNGHIIIGAWQFLIDTAHNCVLVVSTSDVPPIYIPLSAIEFIALDS